MAAHCTNTEVDSIPISGLQGVFEVRLSATELDLRGYRRITIVIIITIIIIIKSENMDS